MLLAATRPLTLDEAIEIALKQNQSVSIARYGVAKAEAQRKEALGNALPSLALTANYNRNIQAPVFFVPNFADPSSNTLVPARFGLNNAYNVGASLNQILFNSAVFSGIGAAGVYVEASRYQYRAAVAEVVTETRKRFYSTLAAREFVRIAQSTLDLAVENKKNIDALFAEGLVAEFDAIRADVAVENVRPEVTAARAGYRNSVTALMTYLNMSLADTVEPQLFELTAPAALPEVDPSVSLALKNNYELVALETQLDVSHRLIDVYQSNYYPSLSLIGQFQNSGQSDDFVNWVSASSTFVGVVFNFNIFNGFRYQAQVEQADADYQSLRETTEQVKNLIRLQVSATINDLASAKERIEAQQSTVAQAQRGYDIARIRYDEGTGSLLEINDSQTALARSQVNRLAALVDYYTRLADFDKATGQVPDKYMRMAES
jgi:outer membrane protein TolC